MLLTTHQGGFKTALQLNDKLINIWWSKPPPKHHKSPVLMLCMTTFHDFSCNIVIGAQDLTPCVYYMIRYTCLLRLNSTRMELLFSVSLRKTVTVRPCGTPPINGTGLRMHIPHKYPFLWPPCDCSVADWCSTDRFSLFSATTEWRGINLSSAAQCHTTKTPT